MRRSLTPPHSPPKQDVACLSPKLPPSLPPYLPAYLATYLPTHLPTHLPLSLYPPTTDVDNVELSFLLASQSRLDTL